MISIEVDGIEYRYFDHLFAVSRCGKALRKFIPYEPTKREDGYLMIGRHRYLHRAVAVCWIPNPNGATHVHHINANKGDARAENLEWVTPKEHFGDRHHGIMGKYIRTEVTRQKIRDFRAGFKDAPAVRARKAEILAEVCPKRPCKYMGVEYPSVAAAARVAKLHPSSFRLRCLSKNFPDYELIYRD